MSSPFQKAFMGKDPIKTIKLSNKDLEGKKSGSSQPAKEISYEGQGGKDYENRPEDAINPEGQGGIDYEAEVLIPNPKNQHFGGRIVNDYKKKTSPLDSYANPGQVKYFSNKADFKNLQDTITGAVVGAKKKESDENDYKTMADPSITDEVYNQLAIKHNKKQR
tara:strand:+ start:995 stop:1486 length:492 start_codon:yes stop_codon:yes gene_type:complete